MIEILYAIEMFIGIIFGAGCFVAWLLYVVYSLEKENDSGR
jgi:hypothetical protein